MNFKNTDGCVQREAVPSHLRIECWVTVLWQKESQTTGSEGERETKRQV